LPFTFVGPVAFFLLQGSAIRRIIQDLQADTRGNVVDDQCSLFLSELSGTDTAISGGGFFYITKEYLAAVSVINEVSQPAQN
jgi:hypothetical protein